MPIIFIITFLLLFQKDSLKTINFIEEESRILLQRTCNDDKLLKGEDLKNLNKSKPLWLQEKTKFSIDSPYLAFNIVLNNGMLSFARNILLHNLLKISGPGFIDINEKNIYLKKVFFENSIRIRGRGSFTLRDNITLTNASISFFQNDHFSWIGQGHVLEIEDSSYLEIEEESTIIFSEMLLKTSSIEAIKTQYPKNVILTDLCWEINGEVFFIKNSTLDKFTNEYQNQANQPQKKAAQKTITQSQITELNANNQLVFSRDSRYLYDGMSFAIILTNNNSKQIILEDNVTVTLQNCNFYNFSPNNVVIGKNSRIIFGKNNNVFLSKKIKQNPSLIWNIEEDATIWGTNQQLELTQECSINLLKGNANLKLQNLRLNVSNQNAICLENNTTLECAETEIFIGTNGLLINKGKLVFSGQNSIWSAASTLPTDMPTSLIYYNSKESIIINKASTLSVELGSGICFDNNPESIVEISCLDASSILYLDYCTIFLSGKTLMLKNGLTIINNKVTFCSQKENPGIFYLNHPAVVQVLNHSKIIFEHTLSVIQK